MPPGPAKKCSQQEAIAVAGYIHDAFYSPLARERNKPARIELARLTVKQYRNTVTDLIASFRPLPTPSSGGLHGLKGEYFKSPRFRPGDRVLERVDPEIRFDYGTAGALAEQTDPYLFSMRWDGSVLAPDTGEYEFIVHTEHAARLFINDRVQPLIDAMVKSGNETDYRASIYLLGGRTYQIRLEFAKGLQGVDDQSRLKKNPPLPATISLQWKPPKRAPEVIPNRCLLPTVVPESYVVSNPFPPDDRSTGYERGNSISKAWQEAATQAAIDAAAYVAGHLKEFAGAPDDPVKVADFCARFVERAFRRPVTPDEKKLYVERQLQKSPDPESGVRRVVIMALSSPRFLYRETESDGYAAASRLAFTLWDSLPDAELLKAAASGELANRDQIARQAERMIQDPRAWFKLRDFLLQWLKIDAFPDINKDPTRFPGFDQAVAADLRTSLELFLEQTAWSEKSDFRELLLSDTLILNGRLGRLYGAQIPPESSFQPVSLDSTERAGVLTHPYLMACLSYRDSTSPIHRGVLLSRNLLGRALRPPPQAFTPLPATLHPNMTTRQRVALQTKPQACQGCHAMINPLGFTMEKFDAIGRLQTQENGKPIDSSGSYQTSSGKTVTFQGVRDLAVFLADSEESHSAFVERLFHHLVKQPIRPYGAGTQAALRRYFEANGYSIRKLMLEIARVTGTSPHSSSPPSP